MGPRAVLDAVVKRKIPSLRRESNPRTPIVQPIAQRYTDWAITALNYKHRAEKIKIRQDSFSPLSELIICPIIHINCSEWIIEYFKISLSVVFNKLVLQLSFVRSLSFITRAVCEVRGLNLLFRVGTLWRCGDGLFFEAPPLASDVLLTTLHLLLGNVLQTVDRFEISCLEALFLWLEEPRNCMGRDLNWILCSVWKKWIGGTPLEHPPYSPDLDPCELWGKKFRTDQRSAARFREVGGTL
jgi:hypothetical protein